MVEITVGVACYNMEGYVEHCICSILDQSFADFEVVAIDDGSTDGTKAILDSLAAEDRRLRVLHQENMGLGPVKNRIVREARGTFLTFVDADDWIAPDCLEVSHRRAVADDLDVLAFGWTRVEDGTGRAIEKRHDHRNRDTSDRDGMRQAAFSASINPMSCASLVRRGLFLDNALSYPACLHEDIYVTPFLYFYGRRYGYVDRNLYYWRIHRGSTTQSISKSHIDGFYGSFGAWKERLLSEGKYDEFRESSLKGLMKYLSLSRRRIETMENSDPELLRYLKSRTLSIPEEPRQTSIRQQMQRLQPWYQRINLGDATTPGKWDVERRAEFLMKEAPWPVSGRILDAGSNAGGVSIALQSQVDSIVCVEPNTRYVNQFKFVAEYVNTSKIEFKQISLYQSHELGAFDVILMLGLVCHTRHPQLFLDYCSNLKSRRFIFSTQHIAGDRLLLSNKKEVYKESPVMMGWAPTKSTMIGMLEDAGFVVNKAVPVLGNPSAAYAAGFTNSLYLFCTLERPSDTDIDSIVRLSECKNSWT